jgi:hypothetical protein
MNPIELIYSWQALLVATAAFGVTQLMKTVLDIYWGKSLKKRASIIPAEASSRIVGKAQRKSSMMVNRVVLPVMPVILGAVFAMVVPARPEVLLDFVDARVDVAWHATMIYAAWGAACGQFSTFTFDKVKDVLGGLVKRPESSEGGEG